MYRLPGLLTLLLSCSLSWGAQSQQPVWLLHINGAIGPATADYIDRGISSASDAGAQLLVIQMDTPGGLDKSMRDIIQAVLASNIPVATFVSPSGARAASAGTYILYASHIAAMAPATNLGAATPVQLGAPGLPSPTAPDKPEPAKPDKAEPDKVEPNTAAPETADSEQGNTEKPAEQASPPEPATAMERKVINDAAAYIQSLAEMRDRNAEWAIAAVRSAATLTAEQALKQNVIDLMANNLDHLLAQLDGHTLTINDRSITLATAGAEVFHHQPDWRNQFLAVITDPSVAYILLLVGIYGLIFEFSNPGTGLPGILGGISLLIALYALQVLPISYTGLGLMLLGLALMIAEALNPSFGVLGFGGIAAFVIGSIMLMDTDVPAFQIAIPVILAITAVSAALMILLLGMVWRARRARVVSGINTLIGCHSTIESIRHNQPFVWLQGERWSVECDESLSPGDQVRITEVTGLTLRATKEKSP